MARRRLLTDEHWAGLLALPSDERDVIRHCTLAPEDLAALAIKRADHNRLGYALLLCAMRHPGRVLDVGEVPPASMVAGLAVDFEQQVGDPGTRQRAVGVLRDPQRFGRHFGPERRDA